MQRIPLIIFLVAGASLLLELNLVRVFDILWYPNMAYLVITLAMFSFGLAGVFLSLFPVDKSQITNKYMSWLVVLMALSTLLIYPVVNRFPFDVFQLGGQFTLQYILRFLVIYITVSAPFFFAGLILSSAFSAFAGQIRKLYFWDLLGAALGCIIIIPLLPILGTVGQIVLVAIICMGVLLLINSNRAVRIIASLIMVALVGVLGAKVIQGEYYEFKPHMNKRGLATLKGDPGLIDGTWWDPISKIDVVKYPDKERIRWIAYDGGTQTSYFYQFDGDYAALRAQLPQNSINHFWNRFVLASHWHKEGSDQNVLVIGSAGGQETKAALTFGAKSVDSIELVGQVIELGKNQYADYTGNVLNDPRVNVQRDEGRSFLRASAKKYDIIQIMSNHTSSSIAAGGGAMSANYLQTVEAYKEYFTHLSEDGVLHINHHIYPRMMVNASRAWRELGYGDFKKHVAVWEVTNARDNLPTFLIKMTPWTQAEIDHMQELMSNYDFVVNPLRDSSEEFLNSAFYSGEPLPADLVAKVPYNIQATYDNNPFFNHLRRNLDQLPDMDQTRVINPSVARLLNAAFVTEQIPLDVLHIMITAGAAILFALFFTLVPLFFARTGRSNWQGKLPFMVYFASLGAGFIIFQLLFIQVFMKLIGFPLYTYTTVVFTFLLGAGIGSNLSESLQLFERGRWQVPFIGIVVCALIIIFGNQIAFDYFLQLDTLFRVLIAAAIIFPLALFLGMCFPLGILTTSNKPAGTVAWAWAFNGLFTVVGGVFAVISSIYMGFQFTLLVAVAIYLLAMFCYQRLYNGLAA